MTVSHGAATRNNIADTVLADIDADVGAGNLIYRTAGDVEVATCPLSDPAGVVSGAVLTFNSITSDAAATGNASPVAKATVESNGGTIVLTAGLVAVSGGDINLSSLTVAPGDTVSTSSLSYTAAV